MRMSELSSKLEKMYNLLGNKYLTDNFITQPFDFKVKVVYGDEYDYFDYKVEVYSIPDIPKSFMYKPEVKKNKVADGIDISVLKNEFKNYINYLGLKNSSIYGIEFMNKENS